MGFFEDFFSAISGGGGTSFGRNTGRAIDNFQRSVSFSQPTAVDNFLLGPGQSVDPNRDYFAEGVAANNAAIEALNDMRDPGGERTDPNTGRSVREEKGYEEKSTPSTKNTGGGTKPPPPKTKTEPEPEPPKAPETVAEQPESSGELEDEAMETGKKGRRGTILTSAQGLLSDAPVRERRKLKGLIK